MKNYYFNRPVQEFSNNNNLALDRKIKYICDGLTPSTQRLFLELPKDEDRELIADFITDCYNHEQDVAPSTKRAYISNLVYLSRFLKHLKSFKEMTQEDIVLGYLNSLKRKANEDPDQKWVNTHNQRAMVFSKFFKWLTQADLKPEERQISTTPQLKGLRYYHKKQKSSVKPQDIWTPEEHNVFLNYCEDPRIACYHSMAIETGARPGELLALRLGDVKIQKAPSTGKVYASFEVGRYGKTKKARTVSISDAIPYYKVWRTLHPMKDSPITDQAFLFISYENSAKYRNVHLKEESLRLIYAKLKKDHFLKVLDRPDVAQKDKITIRAMLKKPWWQIAE